MSEKETYGAQAIAEDLENLGEEIATDTEMTLTETKPEDFDHDEWKALREAIKAMREKLARRDGGDDRPRRDGGGGVRRGCGGRPLRNLLGMNFKRRDLPRGRRGTTEKQKRKETGQ